MTNENAQAFIDDVKRKFTNNIIIVIKYYNDNRFNIVILLKYDLRYEFNYDYRESIGYYSNVDTLVERIKNKIQEFFVK